MSLLSVSGLCVSLGGRPVLKGVSLDVAPGEFVGLIGPNGAGKSTLLRAALGLVRGDGRILINGNETLSIRQRARHAAYLPQERDIAWPVSVEMLVSLGRAPYGTAFSRPDAEDMKAIDRAMQRMEISAFRDRPATELSGGEKARVLIARVLAQEAPLLLADEPTAGLDPSHQIASMRVFADLASEGRAVVASMHDLGLAARWCSRLILLDRGIIIADGPPRAVLTAGRLRAIYGVEAYLGEAMGGMVIQPMDVVAADAADHEDKE
ncbi:MAG: ABC transporter ATP-binding protein [Mesorhizobium sp.]|uniref:ABC transporter ATP-binding protein n=1 Tax=Mesorhizobium sp. TaxID=1871066 RepID=UPI001ACBFEFE|nr:ABC transporter ATP-binding protein [Mesorhizobium sp.]MBN9222867.1 ABC transporter ATP-binding protein [Mesorhizobium sp.]